jgi:hypothetical protein
MHDRPACGTRRREIPCLRPSTGSYRKPLQRLRIVVDNTAMPVRGAGDVVVRRSLEFYDALGRVMAVKGNA